MARPSIAAVYGTAMADLARINNFLQKSQSLPSATMQGFVAEVLMLRLFSLLEECVCGTACRVACGAAYRNGTMANPLRRCASLNDALNQFKTYNRGSRPLQHLKFTNVHHTNNGVKYVIPPNEPFLVHLNVYGVDFDEMRKLRNHIAHRNKSTYQDYKQIIMRRYGAYIKQSPGVYLVTTARSQRSKIEEYYIKTKVIIDNITKG